MISTDFNKSDDNMTLSDYIALSQPDRDADFPEDSYLQNILGTGTLTRGYADGTCDEITLDDELFPQIAYCITSFDYAVGTHEYLTRYIERNLKSIDCVKVKYEADFGRILCVYGSKPIYKQLSTRQINAYHLKNVLFNVAGQYINVFGDLQHCVLDFHTVRLTNILGKPFNCFIKAGITPLMHRRLNVEIAHKAKTKFPYEYIGNNTPWFDMLFDDDIKPVVKPIRSWSQSEFILRKNKDKINIYFNRISGDRNSANFIYKEMEKSINEITTEDISWSKRTNYLQLAEGCEVKQDSVVTKYLLNHWIGREICSFVY